VIIVNTLSRDMQGTE